MVWEVSFERNNSFCVLKTYSYNLFYVYMCLHLAVKFRQPSFFPKKIVTILRNV
jgi:hypothetical protein